MFQRWLKLKSRLLNDGCSIFVYTLQDSLSVNATAEEVSTWLNRNRFSQFLSTFQNYTGKPAYSHSCNILSHRYNEQCFILCTDRPVFCCRRVLLFVFQLVRKWVCFYKCVNKCVDVFVIVKVRTCYVCVVRILLIFVVLPMVSGYTTLCNRGSYLVLSHFLEFLKNDWIKLRWIGSILLGAVNKLSCYYY